MSEIKELIALLDRTIEREKRWQENRYKQKEPSDISILNAELEIKILTQIKEIVEKQAQNTSKPDEDLVERLLNLFDERMAWILSSAFNCSIPEPEALEDKIRSLLQGNKVESRQSVKHKPVVTMEEIRRCVNIIQNCGSPRPCETCVNNLADLLKFKGMEVRG